MIATETPQVYPTLEEINKRIKSHETNMKQAAKNLQFEEAAHQRDLMRKYQQIELTYGEK